MAFQFNGFPCFVRLLMYFLVHFHGWLASPWGSCVLSIPPGHVTLAYTRRATPEKENKSALSSASSSSGERKARGGSPAKTLPLANHQAARPGHAQLVLISTRRANSKQVNPAHKLSPEPFITPETLIFIRRKSGRDVTSASSDPIQRVIARSA